MQLKRRVGNVFIKKLIRLGLSCAAICFLTLPLAQASASVSLKIDCSKGVQVTPKKTFAKTLKLTSLSTADEFRQTNPAIYLKKRAQKALRSAQKKLYFSQKQFQQILRKRTNFLSYAADKGNQKNKKRKLDDEIAPTVLQLLAQVSGNPFTDVLSASENRKYQTERYMAKSPNAFIKKKAVKFIVKLSKIAPKRQNQIQIFSPSGAIKKGTDQIPLTYRTALLKKTRKNTLFSEKTKNTSTDDSVHKVAHKNILRNFTLENTQGNKHKTFAAKFAPELSSADGCLFLVKNFEKSKSLYLLHNIMHKRFVCCSSLKSKPLKSIQINRTSATRKTLLVGVFSYGALSSSSSIRVVLHQEKLVGMDIHPRYLSHIADFLHASLRIRQSKNSLQIVCFKPKKRIRQDIETNIFFRETIYLAKNVNHP